MSDTYLIRCTSCGTKNRIPSDKVGMTAKCGKCAAPVPTDSLLVDKPVIVTDGDFADKVLKSPLPVLLDCWAVWCGPCKMVAPVLDQLAAEWKGKIRVAKLNTEENPMISSQFQIRSIPTLLVFDNGQLKDTIVGALPRQQIAQKMAGYL